MQQNWMSLWEKLQRRKTAHWVSKNLRKFPWESGKGAVCKTIGINNMEPYPRRCKEQFEGCEKGLMYPRKGEILICGYIIGLCRLYLIPQHRLSFSLLSFQEWFKRVSTLKVHLLSVCLCVSVGALEYEGEHALVWPCMQSRGWCWVNIFISLSIVSILLFGQGLSLPLEGTSCLDWLAGEF